MDHHKLVQPEFLNHQGFLFGGYLLKWVDELAFITAKLEHPAKRFVTVALDNVVFKHRITNGQILRFAIERSKLGTTSVEYNVQVFGTQHPETQRILFETNITFVNIDDSGNKLPL
jgi:acyl-CoA hydrolase